MALDVSKQVAAELALTREVLSSIKSHWPLIIEPLKDELSKYSSLEGFDPEIFLKIITGYFNGTADTLRAADIALANERDDDPEFRGKRDDAIDATNQILSKIKAVLNESSLIALGLSGKTPETPDSLISYSQKALTALKGKPEIVKSVSDGEDDFVKVDIATMIQSLEKCISNLVKSLDDVKVEERELQVALNFRNQKEDEWKNAYYAVASILSGLYLLGGKSDLADKIRPTARRSSGGNVVNPEPDPAPADSNAK